MPNKDSITRQVTIINAGMSDVVGGRFDYAIGYAVHPPLDGSHGDRVSFAEQALAVGPAASIGEMVTSVYQGTADDPNHVDPKNAARIPATVLWFAGTMRAGNLGSSSESRARAGAKVYERADAMRGVLGRLANGEAALPAKYTEITREEARTTEG